MEGNSGDEDICVQITRQRPGDVNPAIGLMYHWCVGNLHISSSVWKDSEDMRKASEYIVCPANSVQRVGGGNSRKYNTVQRTKRARR